MNVLLLLLFHFYTTFSNVSTAVVFICARFFFPCFGRGVYFGWQKEVKNRETKRIISGLIETISPAVRFVWLFLSNADTWPMFEFGYCSGTHPLICATQMFSRSVLINMLMRNWSVPVSYCSYCKQTHVPRAFDRDWKREGARARTRGLQHLRTLSFTFFID